MVPVYREVENLHRVTLTPALINQARMVAFLVAGAEKAATLRKSSSLPRTPSPCRPS